MNRYLDHLGVSLSDMKYLQTFEDVESLKNQINDLSQGKRIIFLLSCTKSKISEITTAQRLYSKSSLFSKSLKLVRKLNNDNLDDIRILSAKYGLVHPDQNIEPYDLTLNSFNKLEKQKWTERVLKQISKEFGALCSNNSHYFVFFTGKNYAENLVSNNSIMFFPKNMGIGNRLKYLTSIIDEIDLIV